MSFCTKLLAVIKENMPSGTIICKVISYDKKKQEVDAHDLINDIDVYGIKLQSATSSTGLLIYPAVGSIIYVSPINNDNRNNYVSLYSEIESIELRGNQYGGLVIVDELRKQIDKNSAIINAIMQILNGVPLAEPGNGSPSVLQNALSAAIKGKTTADLTNIENKEVKHG